MIRTHPVGDTKILGAVGEGGGGIMGFGKTEVAIAVLMVPLCLPMDKTHLLANLLCTSDWHPGPIGMHCGGPPH